jgi:aarF domain-containing kinase
VRALLWAQVPFLKDRTDLVALIDEFAGRFYDELDYNMECQNGLRMVKNMADIPQVTLTFTWHQLGPAIGRLIPSTFGSETVSPMTLSLPPCFSLSSSLVAQVVVPVPYPEFTSRRVHVAEWLDGEKLSQSTADDVQELVNVGVVAYLTQLLDSGFFHAGAFSFSSAKEGWRA